MFLVQIEELELNKILRSQLLFRRLKKGVRNCVYKAKGILSSIPILNFMTDYCCLRVFVRTIPGCSRTEFT